MAGFFDMGGFAAFVWPCYALTLGGMAWLAYASWRRAKSAAARLEEMSPKQDDPADTA
ncbi:MAG: heme exporter protein CcmD [Candidatus Puniceispirillaceae bacterium]